VGISAGATPRTVLVTGGAGFIGSNTAARLAARPDMEVVVCDRLREASLGKWRNLNAVPLMDLIHPDELAAFLAKAGRSIAAVVHMGAVSSTTEPDADKIVAANIGLSKRIWGWCVEQQKPLIYASSAATYGDGEQGFVDANDLTAVAALSPLNAYGWSKKAFDVMALKQAARGSAPPRWGGLRFFNVYGPNERHKGGQKSVVAHIYPQIRAGAAVKLFKSHNPAYEDGKQLRDFIFVQDCVDVIEWLLEGERHAGLLNVGTGQARSFLDLAHATFAAEGKKLKIEFVDTPEAIRANYQYFTQADMTRLRELGYERQFTPLEAGVATYVTESLRPDADRGI
jgi:ADP-L-glycero-D-manno-heptose 6-epimerase